MAGRPGPGGTEAGRRAAPAGSRNGDAEYAIARERMVAEQLRGRGIRDEGVLAVMGRVPRHRFVQEALAPWAYGDLPLPIGDGQTISHPYIVGRMTEALGLRGGERVLEVGTGSGYQTALLASLAEKVFTVERLRPLAERAARLLGDLGYYNVRVRVGDGTLGWAGEAPFDAILVAAAAPAVPRALLDQLGPGGRLVLPVGDLGGQILRRIMRWAWGDAAEDLGGCTFVKLVGAQGWPDGDA